MNAARGSVSPTPPLAAQTLEVDIQQAQPMALCGAFRCEATELLALVGPSGAGKTSMLRVLAGLTRPQQGRISIGSTVWCDTEQGIFVPAQRRHVGLVFQDYALMPHLTALHNVALSLLHLPRAARLAKARHWLDHVQLTPAEQARRPAALSGGQQQRVAVARALAREPRLLLLDEPFSSVDQMNRRELYRLLAQLRRDLAIPILLVTHDLNEARLLSDTLVVMDAGLVLQQGSPEAVHRAPAMRAWPIWSASTIAFMDDGRGRPGKQDGGCWTGRPTGSTRARHRASKYGTRAGWSPGNTSPG